MNVCFLRCIHVLPPYFAAFYGAEIPRPDAPPTADTRRVLVMVGLPGCGKSTLARKMTACRGGGRRWKRVNQDEMGSRRVCEQRMEEALKAGHSVIVDRCNFDVRRVAVLSVCDVSVTCVFMSSRRHERPTAHVCSQVAQRHGWVALAKRLGVGRIDALVLDISADVCKQRVTTREGHQTIAAGDPRGLAVVDRFSDLMQRPLRSEGFASVYVATSNDEAERLVSMYCDAPLIPELAPPRPDSRCVLPVCLFMSCFNARMGSFCF